MLTSLKIDTEKTRSQTYLLVNWDRRSLCAIYLTTTRYEVPCIYFCREKKCRVLLYPGKTDHSNSQALPELYEILPPCSFFISNPKVEHATKHQKYLEIKFKKKLKNLEWTALRMLFSQSRSDCSVKRYGIKATQQTNSAWLFMQIGKVLQILICLFQWYQPEKKQHEMTPSWPSFLVLLSALYLFLLTQTILWFCGI